MMSMSRMSSGLSMGPSPAWPRTLVATLGINWSGTGCRGPALAPAPVCEDCDAARRPEPIKIPGHWTAGQNQSSRRRERRMWAVRDHHLPGSHHHHHHRPRHQVSAGVCRCIDCVSWYWLYTPTHPLQEEKGHVMNNVPTSQLIVTTLYCVKLPRPKPSLFDVECYMFLFCWSSLFTCVSRVLLVISVRHVYQSHN